MNGINKVILIGRLGKDPDVRFTPDGKAIANITLATSESWKDKNTGQKQEKTEWHRVVFFGGIAQVVSDYVKKGSQIYIEGKLTTRKWQDNTGQDKYTTEIIVDGFNGVMQMLDSQNKPQINNNPSNFETEQKPHPQQNTRNQQEQQQGNQESGGLMDDDIPFGQHERFLL